MAHKSFELRPLGSLGRETAVAGFLLNSFREHPEQFLKLLTEYKMTFFAPRRLRLSSRLPPDVTDIIGLLASPTERITPLVIRIDSVYRQHAQRVGELLQEAQRVRETGQEAADFIPEPNECFDIRRLVGTIELFPAAKFRQLILRGENMYKPIPEEYLAPALKFAQLLERFPNYFPVSRIQDALLVALRSGESIVTDIEIRPLVITRDPKDLDAALTALA